MIQWMTLIGAFLLTNNVIAVETLPFRGDDFPCIRAEVARRYVRDFNINTRSFGGLEYCNSEVDTKKLFDDLYLIEKGTFAGNEENVFTNGFVSSDNYYNWSTRMTRGVRRGHDIPHATAYNSFGYFTMQNGWAALSSLGRVGVFIHEARHTAGYRHIACTKGPYSRSRQSGCDRSIEYGGSHAVEMEYYAMVVLRGENFHPVYKSMARLMALGRSNFVFNNTPVSQREALLMLPENSSQPILLDGENSLQRLGPIAQGRTLKRTSFGASLFSVDNIHNSLALDLYSKDQGEASIGDDYSYYKLFHISEKQIDNTLDVEEFDVGHVRFLVVINESGELFSYRFPDGRWSRSLGSIWGAERLVTVAPNGEQGLFVLTNSGEVHKFHALTDKITKTNMLWPSGVRNFAKWKGQLLRLTDAGVVEQQGITTQQWGTLAILEGEEINQLLTVPLYDSFEIHSSPEHTHGTH